MALFFNALGWLLAIIGIFLLRRAVFQPRVKWILAAVAVGPKILFLGVQSLSAPVGLSFTIEPRTLATSSALWS
jgi:glycopeptide antibiotics resistance protein